MLGKIKHLGSTPLAFTLIEVLVVVAIIALLCAILMSQLARARKRAQDVMCQANLRQWATIWAMYCQTNKDSFSEGVVGGGSWHRGEWIIALRSQYYTKMNILRCPLATTRLPGGEEYGGPFNTYYMPLGGSGSHGGEEEPSYGVNSWVYNPLPDVTDIQGRPTEYNWRVLSQAAKSAHWVPVFGDCMWRGGGPYEEGRRGNPPAFDGAWSGADAEMEHFCINRHGGRVNLVFMDWSVRSVDLKQLWKLKWHRRFDTAGPWTRTGGCAPGDWPAWMQHPRFTNY
jgi:prepilin-type N-terminal cleavage/methylation domain-containing protein/prepilin-type processing-associated H-X9-DG protein